MVRVVAAPCSPVSVTAAAGVDQPGGEPRRGGVFGRPGHRNAMEVPERHLHRVRSPSPVPGHARPQSSKRQPVYFTKNGSSLIKPALSKTTLA